MSEVGPSVSTPVRVPGSVRRTTSIEMHVHEDGQTLIGRARDLVTPRRGDAVVTDEASFSARIGEFREGSAKVMHAGLHGNAAREFPAIVAERGVAFDNIRDDRRAVNRKDQLSRWRCFPGRFFAGS